MVSGECLLVADAVEKGKNERSNFFPVRPSKPVFRNQTRHGDLAKVAG
jgi:hypothetical protein